MTSHTLKWKEKQLQELKLLADKHPVIAVASLSMFPANLFQEIRKKLHDKADIRVSKTRVIKKAFEQTKLKDSPLLDKIEGSIGIIFTDMNPFELYGFLKKNKGDAPAKTGTIAPNDIVVTAGDTGLPPGPALSDLKAAGLNVKVAGPTIEVTEDKVVTKKGEPVSEAVAGTLAKLDIKPIKIGMNLSAVLEKGELFLPEVLDIDTEEVYSNFQRAYQNSFNLAFNISYITEDTLPLLISKAFRESKGLALEAEIFTKDTIEELLGKAHRQGSSLKSSLPESAETEPEKKKEEKKEEKEEKQEDSKEENAGAEENKEEKEESSEENKEEKEEKKE